MKIKGKAGEIIELGEFDLKLFQNSLNESISSSLIILWFLEDGNQLLVDGKKYFFNKNQIVFFTEFHKIEVLEKSKSNFLRFNRSFFCIIDHDIEVSCKGILFFGASRLPIISIPKDEVEYFEILWKMFRIEMNQKDNLQIGMLQMMLKRYLILSTRLYKEQNSFLVEKNDNNIIREFNFLVEKHFDTKHTVADYAKLLHKSPKTISNIFLKIGAKTPLSYIQDRKILEARRMLRYSDAQIQEIAYKIGYSDLQAFSRFFKKQEGVSPKQYREKILMG